MKKTHNALSTSENKLKLFQPIILIVAVIWIVEAVNLFSGHDLCRFGILPRSTFGLVGIVLSPFLHVSLTHALVNTPPLFILGTIVLLHGQKKFFHTISVIIIIGGLALWLIGNPGFHCGASGLIFGLFGYLVARGIFRKSVTSFIVALVVFFAYGSILWGVLPLNPGVSFMGHLTGLGAGVLAARLDKQ